MTKLNLKQVPDSHGYFGEFGGKYVPEVLVPAITELEHAYAETQIDQAFQNKFNDMLENYSGRPTALTYASRLTEKFGKAKIYLKREDLNHTGAHKINNAIGQIMLALKMGKKRIIAETGAGQHGVATATVAAKFGLECHVYMGEEDIRRQELNVFRMRLLGAEVISVKSGSRTLKDAVNEAFRDWVTNVDDTFYVIGSVVGPHPYPMLVRDFQSVIGHETKKQFLKRNGKLPDYVVACVGGGSNAMGMFYPFINDASVKLIGVEAAGCGVNSGKHAATLTAGSKGLLHGALTYLLQDNDGQIQEAHSISAGLDYPGVGPEHSFLKDTNRVEYHAVTDEEALEGFSLMSRTEGVIPALETAHAIAYVGKMIEHTTPDESLVLCLSGRGDKDVNSIQDRINLK